MDVHTIFILREIVLIFFLYFHLWIVSEELKMQLEIVKSDNIQKYGIISLATKSLLAMELGYSSALRPPKTC